jgi:hypothetical protein
MEILNKLFGSSEKVRMMRLFILNPTAQFSVDEIVKRTQTGEKEVRVELALLGKISLIKRRIVMRKENPEEIRAKKTKVWGLDSKFIYLDELKNFLINANLIKNSELIKRLGRIGKIKLIVIAGVFLNQLDESKLDLLVVGDGIRRASFENIVKSLESELGKEIKYAFFCAEDFAYRLNMYDKLVRDLLDYPHQVVLDRIGLSRDVV